jgi:hypothetical protein
MEAVYRRQPRDQLDWASRGSKHIGATLASASSSAFGSEIINTTNNRPLDRQLSILDRSLFVRPRLMT